MPVTSDRCAAIARDIREHTDPQECPECAALAVLANGFVQMARAGYAPQVSEHYLAEARRALLGEEAAS